VVRRRERRMRRSPARILRGKPDSPLWIAGFRARLERPLRVRDDRGPWAVYRPQPDSRPFQKGVPRNRTAGQRNCAYQSGEAAALAALDRTSGRRKTRYRRSNLVEGGDNRVRILGGQGAYDSKSGIPAAGFGEEF